LSFTDLAFIDPSLADLAFIDPSFADLAFTVSRSPTFHSPAIHSAVDRRSVRIDQTGRVNPDGPARPGSAE
jgi:hypothetical protein